MVQYIYHFDEGSKEMSDLLGSKGAHLAEMTKLGIRVPFGFTISTESCKKYYTDPHFMGELMGEIQTSLKKLEWVTKKEFGNRDYPLLVSVRSGASVSMPGMMDTILNLGLNDESVIGLANVTQNEWFAYDSYRRFIMMYSEIACGIPRYKFEKEIEKLKANHLYSSDLDLTIDDLKLLIDHFKMIYFEETQTEFPKNPMDQLREAVQAVFQSWNNSRAKIYRQLHHIPDDLGTGVTVQMMVFGNMGMTSGTGVVFTRNPSTGEKGLFGEYLLNAQGEDVVAGIRTPKTIQNLHDDLPQVYEELLAITNRLEAHYKDMQDIEFTIENQMLYLLQTRKGKRTAKAAITIAVELVDAGIISKEEAILRIDANTINQLLHPIFDKKILKDALPIAQGLAASPGAVSGKVIFSPHAFLDNQDPVILVRQDTSPEDIEGMIRAEGILTSRGGMTSHAAVVARGMGKCCICGCSELLIDEEHHNFQVNELVVKEGDIISLDGATGFVYLQKIPTEESELSGHFGTFMKWVDEIRQLRVLANAETPHDVRMAFKYGAEGIGLCRTEHMFFEQERIQIVRKMILAKSKDAREVALNLLLPIQKADFMAIFRIMGELPCTIRLLDPPLHEFLPKTDLEIKILSDDLSIPIEFIKQRIEELKEVNPMLGHRGCRLAVTYPEIYAMQVQAIFEAAIDLKNEGLTVHPEVMIPLIGDLKELQHIKRELTEVIQFVLKDRGVNIPYLLGTMIEVPRAALIAGELAKEVDFFSFGTNDLTQMTYGYSRDDAFKFMKEYEHKHILINDPFAYIDEQGVGKLMTIAKDLGRQSNQSLKIGVCGEHGGEPGSIAFFSEMELDYVSCSPYRVPIARLSCAQAEINRKLRRV